MSEHSEAFRRLYTIIERLRSPSGCPWDRKQTPASLRPFLVEEIYECFEAMDEHDAAHVKEELGDIYMLVTMIAYMNEQAGSFRVDEVLNEVCEKLVRRHPHVFGDVEINTSDEVIAQWAQIKNEVEGRKKPSSLLDAVPKTMPPLERATRIQERAAGAGFDWTDVRDVWAKVKEEIGELDEVLASPDRDQEQVEAEFGDLLFSIVNLARFLKTDPTLALHRTNAKFSARFAYVEQEMQRMGRDLKPENMEQMDRLWEESKSKA